MAMPFATWQTTAEPIGRTSGPNTTSKPAHRITGPKRRAKPVRIARLYPEPASEPLRHARALIDLIQEECPDFVGLYVPRLDLERTYRELCATKSWQPHHWTAIARQLGAVTKKQEVKRSGTRFVAYQIPQVQFRSRSAT